MNMMLRWPYEYVMMVEYAQHAHDSFMRPKWEYEHVTVAEYT